MKKKWIAYLLFGLGVFLLLVHTTIAALWTVLGVSSPIPLTGTSGFLFYLPGISPPLGGLMLLLAGLAYGAAPKGDEA